MKTVHLIGSAHLDAVWRWPWAAGAANGLGQRRAAPGAARRAREMLAGPIVFDLTG